jgi:hypothetical protein
MNLRSHRTREDELKVIQNKRERIQGHTEQERINLRSHRTREDELKVTQIKRG